MSGAATASEIARGIGFSQSLGLSPQDDPRRTHYPTSAELAAFRRSIAPAAIGSIAWRAILAADGGAFQDELENGIGYTYYGTPYRDAHDASRARKGARLIRSGMAVTFCGNRP